MEDQEIQDLPNPNVEKETQNQMDENIQPTSEDPKSTNATIQGGGGGGEQGKVKRKNSSTVWDHFTKNDDPKRPRATCNYCGISYACDSKKNGTKNLKNHTPFCSKYPYNKTKDVEKGQTTLSLVPKRETGVGGSGPSLVPITFSVEACRIALTEMIIIDELPFRFVENEGFRRFMSVVQPRFTIPSRTTIARDVLNLYVEMKKGLKSFLKGQRICITTDTWTSIQNINYMCLTAHFIDKDWILHKKILNFCQVKSHKGELLGKVVEGCLLDWGIDSIFTITVDNASSNNGTVNFLKRKTKGWKGTIVDHEYLHMRCCAHILNLVVGDGLKEIQESIAKIRNAVKYVKSSPSRKLKFKECIEKEKIDYKSLLCLDVPTRWNSTYMMLEAALKFEKAFDRMEEDDDSYISYFGRDDEDGEGPEGGDGRGRGGLRKVGPPKSEDWEKANTFVTFLKIFYDATLKFSGSLYVTSNAFFHELIIIQSMLTHYQNELDFVMSSMAISMQEKFNKYWDVEKINFLLFIAIVLDPRYKLKFVEFWFKELYGGIMGIELSNKVRETLVRLFDWYDKYNSSCASSTTNTGSPNIVGVTRNMDPRAFVSSKFRRHLELEDNLGEVDKYLLEACEGENNDFNILAWWKSNQSRYKVLSLVARDVLAIPVSTVASESAFSTGGRILDPFRSSLTPGTVEALICGQNWLRTSNKPIDIREAMEEIQQLEKLDSEVLGGSSSSRRVED